MRTVGTALAARQASPITQPGYLISLAFDSETVRLSSRGDQTALGHSWYARDFQISGLSSDGDASAQVTIKASNGDNYIGSFVLADGYAGIAIQIYSFWQTVAELMLEFDGQGDSVDSMTAEYVSLRAIIESADNLLTPNTPRIVPPTFNFIVPAGYEYLWEGERYTLKRR